VCTNHEGKERCGARVKRMGPVILQSLPRQKRRRVERGERSHDHSGIADRLTRPEHRSENQEMPRTETLLSRSP